MSCSVNIRESPISDTKMDISDPTNSIGSTAVSPEIDMIGSADACNRNSIDESYLHVCDISILASGKKNDDSLCVEAETSSEIRVKPTLNENGEIQRCSENQTGSKPDNRTQKLVLDNRYVEGACRPALLNLSEKHMSSLTVANRHPLMSPTSTDSESENSCLMQSGFSLKLQNFPDLIPNEERHMTRAKDIQRDYKRPSCDIRAVINKAEQSASAAPANTLNCNKVLNKLSVLRASAHSPDLLSSGSEADASLYHAAVGANLQSVVLISNANNTTNASCVHGRVSKRNGVIPPAGSEDISSLDSISNHSFDDDEDLEHNLASLSPSSSIIDGLDDDDDECEGPEIDDDFVEATTPTNTRGEDILPQYTAEEERRDSRNWQKITLPDGSTREIDMKVIEPYKRVLSHGGYLKAGGQNAIVIFCACHLPDRSRTDYHYVMDNLFLYVVKTLEQLVTEDYVLIYLHGGTSRRNVPSFPWLKKCYQLLDRRLRKSLKNMYLVHPTFWIKSIVWMARPFVSAKFWRKLIYVKSLQELGTHVAVEKAAIPDKVKQYDAKYN